MATKKVEKLVKGDDIVLWVGPVFGEVNVLVERIFIYEESFSVGIKTQEIEWAEICAPIGTDVELAE